MSRKPVCRPPWCAARAFAEVAALQDGTLVDLRTDHQLMRSRPDELTTIISDAVIPRRECQELAKTPRARRDRRRFGRVLVRQWR